MGLFENQVMLSGLTNALALFQAVINDILRDMLNLFMFVYRRHVDFLTFHGRTRPADPRLQFMVEVDTSDSGVGAALSQYDVIF